MIKTELIGSYWTLAAGADPTGNGHEYCEHDFTKRVKAAAEAGFTGMGFWHTDLAHLREQYQFSELKKILDDHGIRHVEIEFLLNWFVDDERRKESDLTRAMLLDAAEQMDARHIKIGDFENNQAPMDKIIEEFALLCQQAKERNTNILYEILPWAFNQVNSLDLGLELTRSADAENGGLIFDIWHFVRNGDSNDDIRSKLRPTDLVGAELNDGFLAMPEDLYDATVNHRLLVGEGEFDVRGFVQALKDTGFDGPFGVEIISSRLRSWSLEKVANDVYESTMMAFDE